MNLSHFEALVIFATLVSAVFAITTQSAPKEQFRYGVKVFLYFLGAALILGWIMYPFPL